jgi:hypothetical protein
VALYGNYYRFLRGQYNEEQAVRDFYNWLRTSGIAVEAHRHRSDVKRIVEDYGLFTIVDKRFTSRWMQQQYGKDASKMHQRCDTPARPYGLRADELKEEIEKENKEKAAACVCLDDTQQPSEEAAPAAPDYRQYEQYLKR